MSYLGHILLLFLTTSIGVAGAFALVRVARKEFFALAAISAVGAYTFAALSSRFGLPVPVASLAAVVMAAAVGLAMFSLLDALDEQELVSVSLALQLGSEALFNAWTSVTGGPSGIGGLGYGARAAETVAVTVCSALLVGLVFVVLSRRGRISAAYLAHVAPREASLFGVNTRYHRAAAMVLGTASLGLFGVVQALNIGYVGPTSFSLSVSILLYLSVALAGSGLRLSLCYVCGLFLILVPEVFRFMGLDSVQAALLRETVMGLILILLGAIASRRQAVRFRAG